MYRRAVMGGHARMSRPDQASNGEIVWFENISSRGARIVTSRRWTAGEWFILKSQDLLSRSVGAKVVYCQPLPDGRFAIGCQFTEA